MVTRAGLVLRGGHRSLQESKRPRLVVVTALRPRCAPVTEHKAKAPLKQSPFLDQYLQAPAENLCEFWGRKIRKLLSRACHFSLGWQSPQKVSAGVEIPAGSLSRCHRGRVTSLFQPVSSSPRKDGTHTRLAGYSRRLKEDAQVEARSHVMRRTEGTQERQFPSLKPQTTSHSKDRAISQSCPTTVRGPRRTEVPISCLIRCMKTLP